MRMHIYLLQTSDGYHSRVIIHEKNIPENEFWEIVERIPWCGNDLNKMCEWLIKNEGFKSINYTDALLDDHGCFEERKW